MLQLCYSLLLAGAPGAIDAYENPRPLAPVTPKYTQQARRERIQGTVVLAVRVSPAGDAERVEVVSHLGGGLDEQAARAVQSWRFTPARISGEPVPAWTNVEVHFRLAGEWFDVKQERQRTEFDSALRQHQDGAPGIARKRLESLARKNYPPALVWLAGQLEDQDRARALKLYRQAAVRNHAPALLGEGRLMLAQDHAGGLALVTEASVRGSEEAREWLGRYWAPRDEAQARRYFRLCAIAGRGECQWELARLLERAGEKLQAIAWLEAAAAAGHERATAVLASTKPEDRQAAQRYRAQHDTLMSAMRH